MKSIDLSSKITTAAKKFSSAILPLFQVYILGVVDYANTTAERSEYNNGFAIPITVTCKQGKFQERACRS